MTHHIKRGGQVWIRIFPDKPATKKPAETRQGGGKGAPDHWVAVVKPGRILFEIGGVTEEIAKEAMRLAGHKLPIPTKFVQKPRRGHLSRPRRRSGGRAGGGGVGQGIDCESTRRSRIEH